MIRTGLIYFFFVGCAEGVGVGPAVAAATGVGVGVTYTVTTGLGVGRMGSLGAVVGALKITETTPRSLRLA